MQRLSVLVFVHRSATWGAFCAFSKQPNTLHEEYGKQAVAHNPAREGMRPQAARMRYKPVSVARRVGPQVAVELEERIPCVLRHKGLIRHCMTVESQELLLLCDAF